jgi:hypothetical protein
MMENSVIAARSAAIPGGRRDLSALAPLSTALRPCRIRNMGADFWPDAGSSGESKLKYSQGWASSVRRPAKLPVHLDVVATSDHHPTAADLRSGGVAHQGLRS